jgi:hypothetical protein
MPSADELRAMSDKHAAEEEFIRSATCLIEFAALDGYTSEVVPVHRVIDTNTARKILEANFPNCRITSRWWSNCFKVSWKKMN